MKVTIGISGLTDLDDALGELPKATARNVLHRVLRKAAQPMADTMRALAPDDPATSEGDIKRSILVSTKLKNPVGRGEFAAAIRAGGSTADAVQAMRSARRAATASFAELHVGPDARIFYAHLQEFGTVHHRPQPFARPAWEQHKDGALEIIKSELGGEIEQAANRLARRRAKAAAKKAAGG